MKVRPVLRSFFGCILMLSIPIEIADIRDSTAAAVRICPIVPSGVSKLFAMSINSRLSMVSAGCVANPARTSDGRNSLLNCVS